MGGEISGLPVLSAIEREVEEAEGRAKGALQLANAMIVNSTESLERASQAIVDIAGRIRREKEKQDFITKPIKTHVKLIDGLFKRVIQPLEQARDVIDQKSVTYRLEQQRVQREVAEILASAGEEQVAPVTPETNKSVRVEGGSVSYSPTWQFEITNPAEIPVDLLREVVNTKRGREALEQLVRGYVNAGKRVIPGVKIYQSERTSVRP